MKRACRLAIEQRQLPSPDQQSNNPEPNFCALIAGIPGPLANELSSRSCARTSAGVPAVAGSA